jgi:hypothetical protein
MPIAVTRVVLLGLQPTHKRTMHLVRVDATGMSMCRRTPIPLHHLLQFRVRPLDIRGVLTTLFHTNLRPTTQKLAMGISHNIRPTRVPVQVRSGHHGQLIRKVSPQPLHPCRLQVNTGTLDTLE